MYKILQTLPSPWGCFNEGETRSLDKVPDAVIASWEQDGVIRKIKLKDLPPESSEETSNEETSNDTKRTTYEKRRK